MHSLVRRYLKTGILFLAAGLALGGWMIVNRELYNVAPSPYLVSAHTHAILVGFIMMMILGVALWLFPRPEKSDSRYQPRVAEAAYWLLTIGTVARLVTEILRDHSTSTALRWSVVLSSFSQVAGIGLFFYTIWSRIRPVGSQKREERGERF
jgi:Heme/copper-type cytochrome/quinol oxidases, subunit 1